jgi:hypothetical protein
VRAKLLHHGEAAGDGVVGGGDFDVVRHEE